MKNKDGGEGEGKLNREGEGGACRLSSSEKVKWGGLNRGFTVCDFPEPAHHYYLVT